MPFVNTDWKVALDLAADNFKSLLDNPYYAFSDKKGSSSTYYNLNNTKTTLDEAVSSNYSELGKDSPLRFNKINAMLLYGIQKFEVDLDLTENGIEGADIASECYALPNTITPYVGDYFTLDQLSKPYLFRVTKVTPNLLDTQAIMYKINYTLAYPNKMNIDSQVVDEYIMTTPKDGTNFSVVIKSTVYDAIKELEYYIAKLKDYYISIFYSEKVQTFVWLHNGYLRAYDPYLVEFMIRNKILSNSSNFICVQQQMYLPATFGVDYDRTIFAAIEDKDVNTRKNIKHIGNLLVCDQKMSLLYQYPEDYYYMTYRNLNTKLFPIDIFNQVDILQYIRDNTKTGNILNDILISYFNDGDITSDDLLSLKNLDMEDNISLYYGIPITIFCLEYYVNRLVSKT